MAYIELGDICDISKGEIGITKAVPGEYPMVTTGAERKSHNEFQLDTEAVLIPLVSATGHGHASIKRIHFQEGKFAFGSILAACVPKDNMYSAKFLHIYFQLMKDYILVPLMKGSANVSLTLGNLKTAKVPDISREIQESIVKLYSTLKIEQDEAIGILSNQKSDIDSLRQAILQDAVLGKLTVKWREENPSVEPASELLKRIEAEKQQLIAEKKIKKEKEYPEFDADFLIELPQNWQFSHLGKLSKQITDGTHHTPTYVDKGVKFLSVKDISSGKINLGNTRYISEVEHEILIKRCNPEINDIMFCRIGTLGIPVIVNIEEPFSIFVSVGLIKFFTSDIIPKYLQAVLKSPLLWNQYMKVKAGGSHTNKLNLRDIPNLMIPVPPKEEQKVIVEKVNSLMALCDELEQQVDNSQTQIEQLMQSCLKEVFEQ